MIFPAVGEVKNLYWKFQEEWRYRLFVYPVEKINGDYAVIPYIVPIRYYDVDINREALNDMEIIIGYNVDYESKVKIKEIIDKFNNDNNTSIIVKESVLAGIVR